MIILSEVSHIAVRGRKKIPIFDNTNFVFGKGHVGLVVPNASVAEIVFDLLVGYYRPKAGSIRRFGKMSWPIGRLLQFRSELSGRKTLRFLSHLYGLNYRDCADRAHAMMAIERYYDRGMLHWPRELQLEFGYFASLLPDFDIYLLEGTAHTSNETFNEAWQAELNKKTKGKMLIYQTNSEGYMSKLVNSAVGLVNGDLRYFPDITTAFAAVGETPAVEAASNRIEDSSSFDDLLT